MSKKKIKKLLKKQNELLERQNKILEAISDSLDVGLCFLPGEDLEDFYKKIRERFMVPETAKFVLAEERSLKPSENNYDYFLSTMAELPINNALKRFWGIPEKQWFKTNVMPSRKELGENEGPWEPDIPPPKNFAQLLDQNTKLPGGKTMSRKAKYLEEVIECCIKKGIITGDKYLNAFLERGSKDNKTLKLTRDSFYKIILALMSEDKI